MSPLLFHLLALLACLHLPPVTPLNIDNCNRDVGVESGALPDTALSASSSYDPLNVGPQHARLGQDSAGGAWCPRDPVGPRPESHAQWLGVNMSSTQVVTKVLTQGRYAGGQGQEYTMAYRIMYWRPGMAAFKEYRDSVGRNILLGNSDTFNVATNTLNPPLIASAIRILPYSNHSRTVCLRVGLIGCPFDEGLVSYSVAQGMVRGAVLELLDITYDGLEDPITGHLTGGLGQLADGKYGAENYRALGENGIVRGYEWVGWKNKSMGPLQMDFTFVNIRKFDQVLIHINNHYTKDIQIFSRAKIYFSNEEGKFGDDRLVDYRYMPDTMVEDARNVSIGLHGEHGRFVMLQLFFADKWMLISEVTFISSKYDEEKPSPSVIEAPVDSDDDDQLGPVVDLGSLDPGHTEAASISVSPSTVEYSAVQTQEPPPEPEDYESSHAGLVIGILLTIISLLVGAILYVVYQARLRSAKSTVQGLESRGPAPSLHYADCISDKLRGKLAASLDFTEDLTATYRAKMRVYGQVSALDTDETTTTTAYNTGTRPGRGHGDMDRLSDADYAEPVAVLAPGPQQERIYQAVHAAPVSQFSLSSASSLELARARHPSQHEYQQPAPTYNTYQRVRRKQRSSSQNIYQSVNNCHSVSKVESCYTRAGGAAPASAESPELNVVRKSQLKIVERLGSGRYGEAHLCYYIGTNSSALVAVKSLDSNCSYEKRREFEAEARVLSLAQAARDINLAPVLGVNLEEEPWYIVQEFSEQGDLTQFLQNHVAESSASKMSDIPTLSYGALIYMATQIASGMKCLESLNFVHKDLATRNCQVYSGYHIKISDLGSLKAMYSTDYYHQLPIRWMAWEAVVRGQFGSKSDVWAFGVTLWEILTYAREQPYEELTDKEVVETLQELEEADLMEEILHQPYNCPRDVYELMLECWAKHTEDRPDFQEISLFLMRKNLGFDPEDG